MERVKYNSRDQVVWENNEQVSQPIIFKKKMKFQITKIENYIKRCKKIF